MFHLSKAHQIKIPHTIISNAHLLGAHTPTSALMVMVIACITIGSCCAAYYVAPLQAPAYAFFCAYVYGAFFVMTGFKPLSHAITEPSQYGSIYRDIIAAAICAVSIAQYAVGYAYINAEQFYMAICLCALIIPLPLGLWLLLYKRNVENLVVKAGLISVAPSFVKQAQQAQWLIVTDDYLATQSYETAWFDEQENLVVPAGVSDVVMVLVDAYFSSDTVPDSASIDDHQLSFFKRYTRVVAPTGVIYKAYRIATNDLTESHYLAAKRGIKVVVCTELPLSVALHQGQRLHLITKVRELLSSESLSHIELNEIKHTYEICSSTKMLFDCTHDTIEQFAHVLSTCSQSIMLMSNNTYQSLPASVEQIQWLAVVGVHAFGHKTFIQRPSIQSLLNSLTVIEKAQVDGNSLLQEYRSLALATIGLVIFAVRERCDVSSYAMFAGLILYVLHITPCVRVYLYAQQVIYRPGCGFVGWLMPIWLMSLLYVITLYSVPPSISFIHMLGIWYGVWASASIAVEQACYG